MATSLLDHLRKLPDDRLADLLRLRPDLVVPVPVDLAALAVRAESRGSVARALDGLDRFTLQVLDALRLARGQDAAVPVDQVLAMTTAAGVDPARVRATVAELSRRCLCYGPPEAQRLVAAVEPACSPYPAGLGRPASKLSARSAALASDPARLRRAVMSAPPAARAVLDRLAAGSPLGTVAPASLAPGSDSPVRWLVDAHLLAQISRDSVELPREVGLLLRRDSGPLRELEPDPPQLHATARQPAAADRAGAGQVIEAIRWTEGLLNSLAAEPVTALRAGGIGVRELRRIARSAGIDETTAAVLLEVCWSAGLLGETITDSGDTRYLPTAGFDTWSSCDLAARWLRLASAWLEMTREPILIGQRDDRERLVNPLSAEVERSGGPERRFAALRVLRDAEPGSAVEPDQVIAAMAWRAPRRIGKAAVAAAEGALAEAALLGLTGLGALTCYARHLLGDQPAESPGPIEPLGLRPDADPAVTETLRSLDSLLPEPVQHVLLQADLTMVVPGPAEPALAAELAVVAVRESPSVFRITPDSVRQALDLGYSATDLHDFFARRSRTAVPQGLTYLVDDVARRHGGIRVGSASGYLRSADEALLAEVAADRRLAGLNLRRLAPTVLISPFSVQRMLAALRSAGYAPVAEDPTGAAVLTRPKPTRAPTRAPSPRQVDDPLVPAQLSAAHLASIVERLRRGEAAARLARSAPPQVRQTGRPGSASTEAHTEALVTLQQALRDSVRVWVGYVDAHGTPASRLVRPVSMGGGYLRAEDDRTEMLHTFALHRITGAALEEKQPPG